MVRSSTTDLGRVDILSGDSAFLTVPTFSQKHLRWVLHIAIPAASVVEASSTSSRDTMSS